MSTTGEPRIALIHDELIRRGGAEVVLEELVRIFPFADVFALYAGGPYLSVNGRRYRIHTSFLQKFPAWWRRHPSRLLPLLPQAAEQFDLSSYDLVISSASGFAKAVVTRSHIPHLCYCHSPTRYLWDTTHQAARQSPPGTRFIARAMLHYLRLADFAAAQRVDTFIANSRYTQARITTYYRRPSQVMYPPVDTAFFTPGQPGPRRYFLLVGRLTPSKNFDQAIEVCEKLHYPLIVVGNGRSRANLKRRAGRMTTLVGHVSPEQLRHYYRSARALLQPGCEDFGIAAVEALACGTPVVALGQGGVREIVTHGQHGYLYPHSGVEHLAEALRGFLQLERRLLPENMQRQALRFTSQRFRDAMTRLVEDTLSAGHHQA